MEQKENCIERDYTSDLKKLNSKRTPEDEILAREIFKKLEYEESLPHIINPIASKRFDEMVKACDLIAEEFSGKLKATVDYEHYSAQITLECIYVDFVQDEFMETLYRLATTAKSICFLPLASGLLRIEITMPYFMVLKESSASD